MPVEAEKTLRTQVAYDDERVYFRFRWAQPNAGGWIHDTLVYHDGEWRQFADPSPWVSDDDTHTRFYRKTRRVPLGQAPRQFTGATGASTTGSATTSRSAGAVPRR